MPLNDRQIERFRQALVERREELAELGRQSAGARAPVELDQTTQGRLSRMDAMQGQAMAVATARRRELEIARIDAALSRISAGDFGFCTVCDAEIPEKRLALDPAVPTCINCAN